MKNGRCTWLLLTKDFVTVFLYPSNCLSVPKLPRKCGEKDCMNIIRKFKKKKMHWQFCAANVCLLYTCLFGIDGCKEATDTRHMKSIPHFIDTARKRSKGSSKSSPFLLITFSEKSETWFLRFQFRYKPLSTDKSQLNKEQLRRHGSSLSHA